VLVWILPSAVMAGWAVTRDYYSTLDEGLYLLLNVGAATATALFGLSLSRGGARAPIRWIAFTVFFLGYIAQLWWAALDPLVQSGTGGVMGGGVKPPAMLETFRQVTLCYVVAGVAVNVFDLVPVSKRGQRESPLSERVSRVALYCGLGVSAVCLPLMAVFDIGFTRMGTSPYEGNLPFRLAGWILNVQRAVVPGLALLASVGAEQHGQTRVRRWGMVLLFGAGALDSVITTSKMPIVLALVRQFFLLVVTGRLSKTRRRAFGVAAVTLGLSFPAFGVYRVARTLNELDAASAMSVAVAGNALADAGGFAAMVRPALFRVTGAGVLAALNEAGAQVPEQASWSALMGEFDVTAYVTQTVFGFSRHDAMGVAPSILGWLYVAFGPEGEVVGIGIALVVIEVLWVIVVCSRLRSRPVQLVQVAVFILLLLVEGTLEGVSMSLAVIVGAGIVLEWVARVDGRRTHPRWEPRRP